MLKKFTTALFTIIIFSLLMTSTQLLAAPKTVKYAVTITNLTPGQTFTPFLVATHDQSVSLFTLGAPASNELAAIAEAGNIQPMIDALTAGGSTLDTQTNGGLLGPGKSVTIEVSANAKARFVSVAAMLIPTNDAFVSINRVALPIYASVHTAYAYDAGSEPNDELCKNIPGPFCKGEGGSPDRDGEGFVHIHSGIHGIGDLKPQIFDWRNPVAKIGIKRVL